MKEASSAEGIPSVQSYIPDKPKSRKDLQREERLRVRPGIFAHLFVRRPKLTCLISVSVPILAGALVAILGLFQLNDPTGDDYLIRNDLRTRQNGARIAAKVEYGENIEHTTLTALQEGASYARELAEEELKAAEETGSAEDVEAAEQAVAEAKAAEDSLLEGSSAAPESSDTELPRSKKTPVLGLALVFRKLDENGEVLDNAADYEQGENILDRKAIAEMKRLEDLIVESDGYKNFCYNDEHAVDCEGEPRHCDFFASITNHPRLYGMYDEATGRLCGRRAGHDPVSESEFDLFLAEIVQTGDDGARTVQGGLAGLLGQEVTNGTTPETFIARSSFEFGRPVEGYESSNTKKEEQVQAYLDWADAAIDQVESSAEDEGVLNLIVIGETHVNSVFADQALKDLSYAVLAITLVMVFIWIHTESLFLASSAMLQVLLAFPLAFFFYRLVAQVKYFSSLQIMTIFVILGIAADDVFVFTDAWKQAAVVLGHNVDLERRMAWTYKRAVKAMAVTSLTTAMAFFVTGSSPVMPISTLGIWAAFLVLLQYLLVITVYPCATIIWHTTLRPRTFSNGFKKGDPPVYITMEDDLEADDGHATPDMRADDLGEEEGEGTPPVKRPFWKSLLGSSQGENEYRATERFFRNKWIVWIHKIRYMILVIAVAIFAVSVYLTTRLEPLRETEQFLPDGSVQTIGLELLAEAFPLAESGFLVTATMLWGIQGLDRSGTSRYNPGDPGTAILDETFDLKPAESQAAILNACDTIEKRTDLVSQASDDPTDCWIRDFKSWRKDTKGLDNFETFESDSALVKELKIFASYTNSSDGSMPYMKYIQQQRIGFAADPERVVFTEVRFKTDMKEEEPYQVMWPFYSAWVEQVDELNNAAPNSTNKAYVVSGNPWMWQITQNLLVRNAFVGLGIMLAVALVVLSASTLNIVVSILATLTIAGIVLNLLAIIFLLGWELGITECIGIIVATGISFDFTSHLANAYVESKMKPRYEKVREALTDLGISVLAGAMSTILASSMLFLAAIVFFGKFAVFVVVTVALSLVWSLTVFIASLLVAGPTGENGSFKALARRILSSARLRRARPVRDEALELGV